MARPETDDDLAAELMDAEDPEPADLLRFDRHGKLISGTYTPEEPVEAPQTPEPTRK